MKKLINLGLATMLAFGGGCEAAATVATIMSKNRVFNNQRGDSKVYRSGKIVPLKVGENYWVNIWAKDITQISLTENGRETLYDRDSPNLTEDRDIYWLRLEKVGNNFEIKVTAKDSSFSEHFDKWTIDRAFTGNYTNYGQK